MKLFEIRYKYLVLDNNYPELILAILARLDQSNLILRGSPEEAIGVVLKGRLVLCLSEPLRIQGIRLRFTGERRLGSGSVPIIKQGSEVDSN